YNLLKTDLPAQMPYFSTATHDGTWLKTFLTHKNHSDRYMSSSADKPAWLGKQDLIFNQNIDKVAYNKESEILSAYGDNTRFLATAGNNMGAEIFDF
ncbi:MAG: hypothetical protein KJO26_02870, partial [Deltaproteobacteria bacterium]|nr:hypothetical protein [Deltaproteobacteria bacterium]